MVRMLHGANVYDARSNLSLSARFGFWSKRRM